MNGKSYRIVEELEDGTDEILDEFATQEEAEAALTVYLNLGHDAYLRDWILNYLEKNS